MDDRAQPTGAWSGFKASPPSASTSDRKRKAEPKPAAAAKPAAKKKQKQKAATVPKKAAAAASSNLPNKVIWSGPPDDDLPGGWPEGWTKTRVERKTGTIKGRGDPYWHTPIKKKKLRSMNEVKRFMAALKKTKGDEEEAWKIFKGKR